MKALTKLLTELRYRIVTDGSIYRVQVRYPLALVWNNPASVRIDKTFGSIADAQEAIEREKAIIEKRSRPWKVVKEL